MRDKFFRAQMFVYRHRGTFGYAAGIGVASITILTMKHKPYTLGVQLQHTSEEIAKKFVEHGGVRVTLEKGSQIILVASDFPTR